MAAVTGNNLTIFAGDDMNVIGCEESCSIDVTAKEIITTTKGSGRGTNREYGSYDATLTATGVMFIHADEATAAAANKQDPTYFHSYIVQGKKVCAKYQITDGSTTKYVIANWIVRRANYTGGAGDYATFDIELALDGQLYESSAMKSLPFYDGPSVYIYTATGGESDFNTSELLNASKVYFITKNSVPFDTIETLALITDVPVSGVGTFLAFGKIAFTSALTTGDIIVVSYDPLD